MAEEMLTSRIAHGPSNRPYKSEPKRVYSKTPRPLRETKCFHLLSKRKRHSHADAYELDSISFVMVDAEGLVRGRGFDGGCVVIR